MCICEVIYNLIPAHSFILSLVRLFPLFFLPHFAAAVDLLLLCKALGEGPQLYKVRKLRDDKLIWKKKKEKKRGERVRRTFRVEFNWSARGKRARESWLKEHEAQLLVGSSRLSGLSSRRALGARRDRLSSSWSSLFRVHASSISLRCDLWSVELRHSPFVRCHTPRFCCSMCLAMLKFNLRVFFSFN